MIPNKQIPGEKLVNTISLLLTIFGFDRGLAVVSGSAVNAIGRGVAVFYYSKANSSNGELAPGSTRALHGECEHTPFWIIPRAWMPH